MRYTARASFSIMLLACFNFQANAAEKAGIRWWPFGADRTDTSSAAVNPFDSAPATRSSAPTSTGIQTTGFSAQNTAAHGYPTTAAPSQQSLPPDDTSDAQAEHRWMFNSPFAKVSWPKLHLPDMPRMQLPRPRLWPQESEVNAAHNAWFQENPDPARPSPLQAVKQGAQRIRRSTRTAWQTTVDVLTPGDGSNSQSSRIARRERPPFWKRMFTAEEPQPQGPRTVTEWMAQERLDP